MRFAQELLRNIAYTSISSSIQRVLSAFSFFILVRYLSLADFGTLTIILSLVAPFLVLASLGMGTLVGTEISLARGKEQYARVKGVVFEYLTLSIFMALVIGGLGVALFDVLVAYGYVSDALWSVLVPVLLFLGTQVILSYVEAICKSYERFQDVARIGGFEVIVRFLALCAALFFLSTTLSAVLYAYLCARFLSLLFAGFLSMGLVREIYTYPTAEKGILRRVFTTYGKWAVFQEFIAHSAESARIWLVTFFVGSEGVAIFTIATKVTSLLTKALPIQSIVTPRIAHAIEDMTYVSLLIKKVRKYYVAYIVGVSALFCVALAPALHLLAPEYEPYALIFWLMTLRLVVSGLFACQTQLLSARLEQQFLFWQYVVSAVVSNVTNVVFLYLWGLPGLALAMALNALTVGLLREWYIGTLGYRLLNPREYIRFDEHDRVVLKVIRAALRKYFPFLKFL